MAVVQNFEILSGKFNEVEVSTSVNYAQKWATNFLGVNM
jgi:hypothetical protein